MPEAMAFGCSSVDAMMCLVNIYRERERGIDESYTDRLHTYPLLYTCICISNSVGHGKDYPLPPHVRAFVHRTLYVLDGPQP